MGGGGATARIGVCLLFLALHATAILLAPSPQDAYGYPFLIAAPVIGLLAAKRRACDGSGTVRIAWLLLAGGLGIWGCGMAAAAWADLVAGAPTGIAELPDFFYFCYGVPIIVALALPDRRALLRRFVLVDAMQAGLAGFLTWVAIFSVVPFSAHPAHPVSISRMLHTYTVENAVLLLIAGLRVLGRSSDPARDAFDRSAALFLLIYAACAQGYNAYAAGNDFSTGLADLLVDLPFLALVFMGRGARAAAPPARSRRSLTLLVDGAAPTFFTLALLWLSFSIGQSRPTLGTVAMVLSLALHAMRSALLEGYHLQTQEALALARDRLLRLSLQDDLTGIGNRRAFQAAIARQWSRRRDRPGAEGEQDAPPLSLLLLDIDHFKLINDRFGHETGDACLRMVASALRERLRERGDRLFRYGGEEFAVLLPEVRGEEALLLADELRAAVLRLGIPNRTDGGDRVTISAGVASAGSGHRTTAMLIAAADQALYEAKAAGRNRVFMIPPGAADRAAAE